MRTPPGQNTQGLAGKRVLVTRPAHQVHDMSMRLREHGAVPVELPVIEIVPFDQDQLAASLGEMHTYDWIIFTSVNTVSLVGPMLASASTVPRIAVIGEATASALRALGLSVDIVPDQFVAESVLEDLVEHGVAGSRILLPRAELARTTLPDGLRAAGANVSVVPVYQTRIPASVDSRILQDVISGNIDIITFTSPSTVKNLLALTNGQLPEGATVACIGPVTGNAAREAGIRVDVVARTYSIPGLIQALIEHTKGVT